MSSVNAAPGTREARYLVIAGLAIATPAWLIFVFHLFTQFALPFAYSVPLVLAGCLVLAIRLVHAGTAKASVIPALLGCAFVVGGAVFDLAATVVHTPDLSREGNPIARTLLDSQHALRFVFAYALAGQGLYVVLVCVLWVALLKHRVTLISSLRGTQTPLVFLKAATGGADLTWRQWLFPVRMSELPSAYHLLWAIVVVMLAVGVDRWYWGLWWFGLIPGGRFVILALALLAAFALYLTWLWSGSRELEPAHPNGTS